MRAVLLAILILSSAVACAPKRRPPVPTDSPVAAPPSFKPDVPIDTVTRDWNLSDVEVSCGANQCPPQVGVLFFVSNGIRKRCTATLVGTKQIITTGHCDGEPKGGAFVLGAGSSRQQRRIVSRVFKVFEESGDKTEKHAPAALIFELDRPVKGLPELRTASGRQPVFNKITVYAVNPSDDSGEKFRIDAKECAVRRHEAFFPYDLQETPDLIWGFDCELKPGNSGSPMFAEGSSDIQGVLQGAADPQEEAQRIRDGGREPAEYEKHWLAFGANLRCLNLPGSRPQACTKYDRAEIERRFSQRNQLAAEELMKRAAPDEWRKDMSYRTVLFPVSGGTPFDQYFEVLYIPECRRSKDVQTVNLPSELVRYHFDEWARAKVTSLGVRLSPAAVTNVSERYLQIEVKWAQPFAPLKSEADHPRQKWGNRFPIDLPQCTS